MKNKVIFYSIILFALLVVVIVGIGQWEQRKISKAGSNCRQMALACLSYPSEQDEVWPPSLEFTVKWSDGELDTVWEEMDRKKLHYFRPNSSPRAAQPAIVYEVSLLFGTKYVIAYCDGHIGTTNDKSVVEIGESLVGGPDYDNSRGGIIYTEWVSAKGASDW